MSKILWVDTETTGLSAYKNGIIQLSGYVEVGGIIKEEFDHQVKPFPKDEVHNKALEVNGITKEQILLYPEPVTIFIEFSAMLERYVNKFDKQDKFMLAGYNVNFDKGFLQAWFRKNGNNFFHSYFDYHMLDVMAAFIIYKAKHKLVTKNIKLATVAEYFGMDANFHNAMDDIRVTRDIYNRILATMGD